MKKVISMVLTGIDPAPLWRQIWGSAFEPRVRPDSGFILLRGQVLCYIGNMTNSLSAKSNFVRYCQRYCGTALAVPRTGAQLSTVHPQNCGTFTTLQCKQMYHMYTTTKCGEWTIWWGVMCWSECGKFTTPKDVVKKCGKLTTRKSENFRDMF